MDDEYMKEIAEREASRLAYYAKRLRVENRHRIALAVFRDICASERRRRDERGRNLNQDSPQDFASHATEAVEAADALLVALNFDAEKQVLPDYEG